MCDWLPELITLEQFDGDWGRYLETIYDVFRNDFIITIASFKKKPIYIGSKQQLNGKELTFWHVISEGKVEEKKEPNLRRCERIGWPRAIIDHADNDAVKIWENQRNGQNRICLWLEPADYLVVLTIRPNYFLLWTAYPLYGEHNRQALRKEYDAWIKAGAARHG